MTVSARNWFLLLILGSSMFGSHAAVAHPAESSPMPASFGRPQAMAVGGSIRFADGLNITLARVNDSRCPAGVQCIWAGELAAELVLRGSESGSSAQTVTLGTERMKQRDVGLYGLTLLRASVDSATLLVDRKGGDSPRPDAGVQVVSPRVGDVVRSPFTVTGTAPSDWYFDGEFPVRLLDSRGTVLGKSQAKSQRGWTRANAVPFVARFTFRRARTGDGVLILEKEIPSGRRTNPVVWRVPVRFAAPGASGEVSVGRGEESGVRGTAMIGPTCPVQRMPPAPGCQDKPYAATFAIQTSSGVPVATVSSGADGSFSARLPPGDYVIRLQSTAVMPSMAPQPFNVRANSYTSVRLSLDSGMR